MANTKSRTPQRAKPKPRIIATDDDVRDGVRALRRKCPTMRRVHDLAGDPPLRRRPAGFEGLARIIVGQQVSVASATAIWGRTAAACTPFEPHILLALEDQQLAGLIMWIPASLAYLIATLVIAASWLKEPVAPPLFDSYTI